ncbi:MAG: undecaprenyl-diphosphate phosphatase [Planctomycetes bacterium]|nr:undecaprenyl-diphosphate phosphatase [Planctomycetota bacterium]
MTLLQAAFLGILQGISEFLPISSSGHLCLAQHLLGIASPSLVAFDVCLHFGSLLAILILFSPRIRHILTSQRRVILYLFLASLPTGLLGLFWAREIQGLFGQPLLVAFALVVTSFFLFCGERLAVEAVEMKSLGAANSLIIGLAQAFAATPGISRSGLTISSALICGVKREDAFEFSFLLAIPAILGVSLYELLVEQHPAGDISPFAFIIGSALSFVFSIASLLVFRRLLVSRKLPWLGGYCLAVGSAALLFLLARGAPS